MDKTEYKYLWTKKLATGDIIGVRSDSEEELVIEMDSLLVATGNTIPDVTKEATPTTPQPPTETEDKESCPKCGSSLVDFTTRNGKSAKKCVTNKWNKVTKQAEGCDYIKWLG